MSDADCTPGREPRSVAASLKIFNVIISGKSEVLEHLLLVRMLILGTAIIHVHFQVWFSLLQQKKKISNVK